MLHDAAVQTGLLNLSSLTRLLESYSCQIDLVQSSSAPTTLGFISKLKIAAQFPFLPFKGSLVSSWEPFCLAMVCCSLSRHLFCCKHFGNQKG